MHPNEELLEVFYKAFQKRDYSVMAECYHPQATFSDPVFRGLDNRKVAGMWKMLLTRAKEFEVTYSGIKANNETGNAEWEAKYIYSATGHRVINQVKSSFRCNGARFQRAAFRLAAAGPELYQQTCNVHFGSISKVDRVTYSRLNSYDTP
jgi:SnoaL-like domain